MDLSPSRCASACQALPIDPPASAFTSASARPPGAAIRSRAYPATAARQSRRGWLGVGDGPGPRRPVPSSEGCGEEPHQVKTTIAAALGARDVCRATPPKISGRPYTPLQVFRGTRLASPQPG